MNGSSKYLSIDIETYCDLDLKEVGVYRYASDPSFEILLVSYSYNGGPKTSVDLKSGADLPPEFLEDLNDSRITKTAWNAQFERVCFYFWIPKAYGIKGFNDPSQWFCTMTQAAALGLPLKLANAGQALGLGPDFAKDPTGAALIRYFSMPCAPTRSNGMRTRNLPHHNPKKWADYISYNGQDVVAENAILAILLDYPERFRYERDLYTLDQRINDGGVQLDIELAKAAYDYSEMSKKKLLKEMAELSGLANANSPTETKKWLNTAGIGPVTSIDKGAVIKLLDQENVPEHIRRFLELRKETGKTSTSKYEAMLRSAVQDPEGETYSIHGMLQFYGATRTGRWAGRIVQLQNLPKNTLKNIAEVREVVRSRDFETLEFLFTKPLDVLSQLIRTALIPDRKTNHVFVVADYSAIEARVIAFIAQEEWKLEVFKRGGKIYEETASRMFNIPTEQIAHDSKERQRGKQAELACGYGGGLNAYRNMGVDENDMSDDEIINTIKSWRRSNKKIVSLWRTAENAFKDAMQNPGRAVGFNGCTYQIVNGSMTLTLPSGRAIVYQQPEYSTGAGGGTLTAYTEHSETKKWVSQKLYGGLLVENIVQAFARDCLGTAMKELDKKGYKIRFHVHDEVVIEVPRAEAEKAMADIKDIMRLADTEWASAMPLDAEAYICDFYLKE